MKKNKKFIILLLILSLGEACSLIQKNDDDDEKKVQTLALAYLLQPKTCTLGEETFIISEGNISCDGVSAEGTGLMVSTKERDLVSILLEFTLNDSNSEVVLYGASDGNLKATGSGFRFGYNTAKAFHFDGTTQENMSGFETTSTKTHCLEIHTGETPPHLIAKINECTDGGEVEFNGTGATQAKKGTKWGFELKSAKIKIVNINSSPIFGH